MKVNQHLEESGCEKLYARSFYEACLIYAFDHQIGYEEWKKLFAEEGKYLRKLMEHRDVFFKGGKDYSEGTQRIYGSRILFR